MFLRNVGLSWELYAVTAHNIVLFTNCMMLLRFSDVGNVIRPCISGLRHGVGYSDIFTQKFSSVKLPIHSMTRWFIELVEYERLLARHKR
jgi:hypothetical protein